MKNDRRTQWLRGILDLCVLATLANGERYGYELAQELEQAGLGSIKGGTLYPLLSRLEKADLVATQWREGQQGPGRKYYTLTPGGKQALAEETGNWQAFTKLIAQLLKSERK